MYKKLENESKQGRNLQVLNNVKTVGPASNYPMAQNVPQIQQANGLIGYPQVPVYHQPQTCQQHQEYPKPNYQLLMLPEANQLPSYNNVVFSGSHKIPTYSSEIEKKNKPNKIILIYNTNINKQCTILICSIFLYTSMIFPILLLLWLKL